ncbi:MAG: hypothetical protein MK135_12245 [Polyangiaceae bacterium]|nr:hypothetical protein [Polyangiaceae bacterium]
MNRLVGRRLLYVTGKGGVGKSTVALSIGRYLAEKGQRVLVCAPQGSGGLLRLIQGAPQQGEPAIASLRDSLVSPEAGGCLDAMLIDPAEAVRGYIEMVLGSPRVAAALFQPKIAEGFLRGLPGLESWALLGRAWHACRAGGPDRPAGDYDVAIFDAPATGSGTDILRVPGILSELAPAGRLRSDAVACHTMLVDPLQSAVVPVAILEELPVTETLELITTVREDLKQPLGPLIINRTVPEKLSPAVREKLAGSAVDDAFGPLQREARRESLRLGYRKRLAACGLPLIELPNLEIPPTNYQNLTPLIEALDQNTGPGYRLAGS